MFYVYALLDPSKPGKFSTPYVTYLYQPFYIGKGMNDRAKQHLVESLQARNKGGTRTHKQNTVLKVFDAYGSVPTVSFDCCTELEAFDKEAELTHIFELRSNGGILTNIDYGGKGANVRSAEVKARVSAGKLKYTFTDEHRANIVKANAKVNATYHLGAKRSAETKLAISKSRYGAKSKVAKIWMFTDPSGHVIVYKGGMRAMVEMFNLSEARLIRFIGQGPIPAPTHTGHVKEPVTNCTGWSVEKIPDEDRINFSLAHI